MGFYDPARRRIVVREAPQSQMTKTLAHELAHHFTGLPETYDAEREAHETTAESVAYVVCAHFGLDTGARSFPYVATWSKEPAVLKASLATIQRVAATSIDRLGGGTTSHADETGESPNRNAWPRSDSHRVV